MPRPVTTFTSNGLPLWDTFEALFFFVSGIFVGGVLGFLLPSLWRTLRRRFRKLDKVAPLEESALLEVKSPLELIDGDDDSEETDPSADLTLATSPAVFSAQGETALLPKVSIAEAFVYARFLVQEGNLREAVKVYLELLKSDRISKGGTNRALFELAQCYQILGMKSRALDTFSELYFRKPNRSQTLGRIVGLSLELEKPKKLLEALTVFQGSPNETLRHTTAFTLCIFAEKSEDLNLARLALRWDPQSPFAKVLIWKITGDTVRKKLQDQPSGLWTALIEDLATLAELSAEANLSPFAASPILAHRLLHLASMPNSKAPCQSALRQFTNKIGVDKLKLGAAGEGVESLVVSALLHLICQPIKNSQASVEHSHDSKEYPKEQSKEQSMEQSKEQSMEQSKKQPGDSVVHWAEELLSPNAAAFVFSAASFDSAFAAAFADNFLLNSFAAPLGNHPCASFFLHQCKNCQHTERAFRWSCSSCKSKRPLQALCRFPGALPSSPI